MPREESDKARLNRLTKEAIEWERKDNTIFGDGPGKLDQHNRLIEIDRLHEKIAGQT